MIRRQYHGKVKTPEYNSWRGMIERCERKAHRGYADYGGRGIKVCDRWRNSFPAFLADMGAKPGPGYSIERRENAKGYEPGNCFWATRKEQNRNKRNNRLITIDGQSKTAPEWAEIAGVAAATILCRIDRDGLTPEEAIRPGVRPKKTTRWIEHGGVRLCLAAWARRLGTSAPTLRDRIKRLGVAAAIALTRGQDAAS